MSFFLLSCKIQKNDNNSYKGAKFKSLLLLPTLTHTQTKMGPSDLNYNVLFFSLSLQNHEEIHRRRTTITLKEESLIYSTSFTSLFAVRAIEPTPAGFPRSPEASAATRLWRLWPPRNVNLFDIVREGEGTREWGAYRGRGEGGSRATRRREEFMVRGQRGDVKKNARL